jgi:hypothetical protein
MKYHLNMFKQTKLMSITALSFILFLYSGMLSL